MNAFELIHESEQRYNEARDQFLTSTQLMQLRRTNAPYIHMERNSEGQQSADPAQTIGRAAHKLILEGRRAFRESFVISDDVLGTHTGNYLTTEEWFRVEAMADAVAGYLPARRILQHGIPEGIVRTEYCGTPCQIRMDWVCSEELYLVELKTPRTLSGFQEEMLRMEYAWQLAFYRAVWGRGIGSPAQKIRCYLLAVEHESPYRVGLYPVTDALLTACQLENQQSIERWTNSKAQGQRTH